jgi:hypothetical protein
MAFTIGGSSMTYFVGLDVSQKSMAICVVDSTGRRHWRGQCITDPQHIKRIGWYRSVHVTFLDAHWTRALLGARPQLVGHDHPIVEPHPGRVQDIWDAAGGNAITARSSRPRAGPLA